MAKLVFKTQPRPYQVPVLKRRIKHKGGGLYVPMRWGKSWLGINWAAAMFLKYGADRCLIVCPNDVIDVWLDEIMMHCPVPWVIVHEEGLFHPEDPYPPTPGHLEFHVVNFEGVFAREYDDPDNNRAWTAVTNKVLLNWRAKTMIVDEAHHIGNPSAMQSVKTYQLARQSRFRLFMTGTPFHRKPFYVFGQFRFYDDSVFGTNFGAFKRHIAVFGGFGGYEIKRYQNLKWLRNKVKPHVDIVKYVPPTPPTRRKILFRLDKSRRIYDEMRKESIVEVGDHEITAPIVLTRHMRLLQIAGGWLKTEDGKYVRVGNEKKLAFQKRVAEFIEQDITRFVVGARFIPELRDIWDVVTDAGLNPVLVHGGVSREERTRRRKRFAKDPLSVFITQFRPSREGIDLSATDTMVFYSLPDSYLTYDQFSRRIEKYGEERSLLYEHLIAKGTQDELAFEALQFKKDVATYIMERPKLVERLSQS